MRHARRVRTVGRMSLFYRFVYGVGFRPWEADAPKVGAELDRLLAVEEAGRSRPYGRALDLGCGTGRWSIELARRGWDVIGVDVIPKAIRDAQRRAEDCCVDVRFVNGDVASLRRAGVDTGFSFVLDVECFNHLDDQRRVAVGREVNAVTLPDATMLLLVWAPARRGPLPPGAGPDDLTQAFTGWKVVDSTPYEGALPRPLRNIAPRWYRMART